MYYTVYKITNLINLKIYIGVHQTNDINDNYMGSGKHLKSAQSKYGIENFEKEILEIFDTPELMFQFEAILVNETFVLREDTYNLKVGGFGGFKFINENSLNNVNNNYMLAGLASKQSRLDNPENFINQKLACSISMKKRHERGEIKYDNFKGKTHSEESKQKQKDTWKNKPLITCPHCNKQGTSESNMRRWHFEKCKKNIA